jgi:hypothetical protein
MYSKSRAVAGARRVKEREAVQNQGWLRGLFTPKTWKPSNACTAVAGGRAWSTWMRQEFYLQGEGSVEGGGAAKQ